MWFFSPSNIGHRVQSGASYHTDMESPVPKTHIADVPANVWANTVEGTLGTARDYVKDIINPLVGGVFRLGNLVNYGAYKERWVLNNVWKSLASPLIGTAVATKNAVWGILGGAQKMYQNLFQDNIQSVASGTTDHVPLVWPVAWNVVKSVATIPALVSKIPAWFLAQLDNAAEVGETWSHRKDAEVHKTLLRV